MNYFSCWLWCVLIGKRGWLRWEKQPRYLDSDQWCQFLDQISWERFHKLPLMFGWLWFSTRMGTSIKLLLVHCWFSLIYITLMFVFKISDRFAECGLLMQCLEELARKYPATKFVKIISTDCIPNYPDRNLPTVLVYNNGAVKANYVGLRSFGRRCTPEGILCMPVLAFTLYHYFYFKFICAFLYNYSFKLLWCFSFQYFSYWFLL